MVLDKIIQITIILYIFSAATPLGAAWLKPGAQDNHLHLHLDDVDWQSMETVRSAHHDVDRKSAQI